MKSVPKLALAALLATGATSLALTAPAVAQKKDKDAKKGPTLSPKVQPLAKAAQDAVNANNPTVAEPQVAAFEAVAGSDFEKYLASLFRYTLEAQKQQAVRAANPRAAFDQTAMARSLDALIANPATPAETRPKLHLQRGSLAYDSKQYDVAIDQFSKARAAGSTDASLDLMIVQAKVESGDVAGGTAELDRVIAAKQAKGEKASAEYYEYAIARANKNKLTAQTVSWLNKYAAAYPTGQTWYKVLATYGFQQDSTAKLDNQQKIDLFRLMRASGGLPDQYFYIEYAQKAQNAGLPLEAQAVLREGLANGKIPAGNSEVKAMQTDLTRAISLEGSLASLEKKAGAAADGKLAGQTGDAYLSSGDWAKAASLYRTALQKGGVDADAINTRLGIALARSGDKAGAQTAFAAVKTAPRADIAGLWTTWLGTTPTA